MVEAKEENPGGGIEGSVPIKCGEKEGVMTFQFAGYNADLCHASLGLGWGKVKAIWVGLFFYGLWSEQHQLATLE